MSRNEAFSAASGTAPAGAAAPTQLPDTYRYTNDKVLKNNAAQQSEVREALTHARSVTGNEVAAAQASVAASPATANAELIRPRIAVHTSTADAARRGESTESYIEHGEAAKHVETSIERLKGEAKDTAAREFKDNQDSKRPFKEKLQRSLQGLVKERGAREAQITRSLPSSAQKETGLQWAKVDKARRSMTDEQKSHTALPAEIEEAFKGGHINAGERDEYLADSMQDTAAAEKANAPIRAAEKQEFNIRMDKQAKDWDEKYGPPKPVEVKGSTPKRPVYASDIQAHSKPLFVPSEEELAKSRERAAARSQADQEARRKRLSETRFDREVDSLPGLMRRSGVNLPVTTIERLDKKIIHTETPAAEEALKAKESELGIKGELAVTGEDVIPAAARMRRIERQKGRLARKSADARRMEESFLASDEKEEARKAAKAEEGGEVTEPAAKPARAARKAAEPAEQPEWTEENETEFTKLKASRKDAQEAYETARRVHGAESEEYNKAYDTWKSLDKTHENMRKRRPKKAKA